MKKRFVILILFALACLTQVQAQGQFRKPLKSTSYSQLGVSNYNVGLKLGCPWSYLDKSDLSETTIQGNFGYLVGLFGERNIGKWSVGLEACFAQRGTNMFNETEYQISLNEDGMVRTTYTLAYNVVTVRVPVTYYFKGLIKDDKVIPYLFVGPEVDIPLPFNFDLMGFSLDTVAAVTQKYDGPTGEHFYYEQRDSFEPGLNVSIVGGLGLMSKIRTENSAFYLKFDVAYNRGLFNMAVPTSEAWKWLFEDQGTTLFMHDVEASLSIVIPIKKILHDACHNIQ